MPRYSALLAGAFFCALIGCSSPDPAPTANSAPPAAGAAVGTPEIVSITPDAGSARSQRFEAIASHPGGAGQIENMQVLFDIGIRGADACWVDYRPASQTVALRTDDGNSWLAARPIGQPGVVENRQCALAAQNVTATAEGNQLKVVIPVSFKDGMRGDRDVYVIASSASAHTGWIKKGHWTIP
ncbi:MAG: hypothetical protein R2762_28050 [Bryobacteraceae bacterium]